MKTRILLLFTVLALARTQAGAAEFYVSPSGTLTGTGALNSPWDLKTALAHPIAVQPGDTIWLRGGRYTGTPGTDSIFTSRLIGTATNPIKVRQYPGERAILDAQDPNFPFALLRIDGAYTWYQDFEVTNSSPTRVTSEGARSTGVDVFGVGTKLINLLVYDAGTGIGFWLPAVGAELYGNIIFNNGAEGPTRGHGHAIYTQNRAPEKRIVDNIVFHSFGAGFHLFGSSTTFLQNYTFEGNAHFNDELVMNGDVGLSDITFTKNYLYNTSAFIGSPDHDNSNLTVTDNVGGTFGFRRPKNTFVQDNFSWADRHVDLTFNTGYALTDITFDRNTYHIGKEDTAVDEFRVTYPGNVVRTYKFNASVPGPDFDGTWQGTLGYDPNGTFVNNASRRPSGVKVYVRPNQYQPGRANIIIYNYDLLNNVNVDVSGIGLNVGDAYEIHSVLDYFNDVIQGTYTGGMISIPMTGHTVALPLGFSQAQGNNTFPDFGVFVIMKKRGVSPPRNLTVR